MRNQLSLKQVAPELGLKLTPEECWHVEQRKEFQVVLRAMRADFFNELANSPNRGKETTVGLMLLAIEQLAAASEWKEVIVACEKLAKLEGWIGADSNVNVYQGYSAKDFAAEKQRLLKILQETPDTISDDKQSN